MTTLGERFIIQKKEVPILENPEIEEIVKKYKDGANYKAKDMYTIYNQAKPKNMLDFKAWKYKLQNKIFPVQMMLINMQLETGHFMQFQAKIKDFGFVFAGGFYIIDQEIAYYNSSAKMWALDYHESLCFPVKRTINVKELKDSLIKSGQVELESTMNPISLQKFMESTVIQKLLAGAELDATLGFLKILGIVNGILTLVVLFLSLKNAGFLGT